MEYRVLLAGIISLAPAAAAQDMATAESVTVVPGAQYRAGWFHRIFLGTRYRALWTTPIRVPVLDLDRFAGGLTPLRTGGGQQTKSLRFRGQDGREYAFRSVDKDPSTILPEELRETIAARLLRDQISAGHPAGALVVAPLLDAVGVLHAPPRLAVMPDSPRLGAFRSEFAGMLGTIEERPDEQAGAEGFAGAREIVGTDAMLGRIEDDPGTRVDGPAFLEARLMDVFLGDWDRHRDQWRWALVEGNGQPRFLPIPRDRDQAFAKYDGLILGLARVSFPQLLNFGPDYERPVGTTWNGRDLDRRLLTGLERSVWDSVASTLQERLTNEVIADAVGRMPPEFPPEYAERMAEALRSRRDALPAAAERYYRLLAGEVDIHATDRVDHAVVERIDDRHFEVRITSDDNPIPWYRRRFDWGETHEVRVFLHGGDDEGIIQGEGRVGSTVRFIGGGGDDRFVNRAPFGRARFYDARGTNHAEGRKITTRRYVTIADTNPAIVAPRDWGRRYRNYWLATIQPDVGLFVSANPAWITYAFRKRPYGSRVDLSLGYATTARTFNGSLIGDFRIENSAFHWGFEARGSGIDILRWHGFGNETVADSTTEYYRVTRHWVTFAPTLGAELSRGINITVGPTISYSVTDLEEDRNKTRFISRDAPYGVETFGQVGALARLEVDRRNRATAAGRGVYLRLEGDVFPGVFKVEESGGSFGSLEGDLATYLSPSGEDVVLALRVGGRTVWGEFPFHEAAFLGGRNARGFRHNRFAGDASAYGNAEVRLALGTVSLIVPGEFGVFGLADAGRVWYAGEPDGNTVHTSFGGGIWFGALGRANTFSVSAATGGKGEGVRFYLNSGFGF